VASTSQLVTGTPRRAVSRRQLSFLALSVLLCIENAANVLLTLMPYAIGPLSVCPVCLSVTLVHCGQTVGWIKMKLGMQVGLGPGHIVLDGDRAPPLPKGRSPQFSAHICCGQMAA